MTSDDMWLDDESWDCVVDGPLSPSQLAELVAACDQRPELWKRCALALLEDQTLRFELQSMARESLTTGNGIGDSHRFAVTPLPCSASANPLDVRAHFVSTMSSKPIVVAAPRSLFWNNLALVATVIIALGIGWQASQRFGFKGSRSPNNWVDPSVEVAQTARPADAAIPLVPVDDASMLASSDGVDPEVIDQVNAETLATAMQVDWKENLDPEYEQLRQRGYEVESHEGLIPVWLYDGRSAVIPYQQIKVRPKSQGTTY